MTAGRHAIALLLVFVCAPFALAADAGYEPDVAYGRKDGMLLSMDVFRPAQPNGAGILLIQSGGWYSAWREADSLRPIVRPYTDAGYTVFAVRHASAPKYTVPEIVEDVRRCVRFIRSNAARWRLDPDRLGAMGASAGGHLSLMLALAGEDARPEAKDEADRASSRVAAVVAFCPPTDLRGWMTDPPPKIRDHVALRPPLSFDVERAGLYSPVTLVTGDDAAVMLIHGDADEWVPIAHSHELMAELDKTDVPHELVTLEKGGHTGYGAFANPPLAGPALRWFALHLLGEGEAASVTAQP